MKKIPSLFRWVLAAAAVVALCNPVAAQKGGNINMGKLQIVPGIEANVIFDDNIFLGSGSGAAGEAEESDTIYQAKPSLHAVYQLPERGYIDVGYDGTFSWYSDFSGNDWDAHQLSAVVDYKAPSEMIFGLNEAYLNTEDPFGSQDLFNTGIKTERWTNTLGLKAGYGIGNNMRAMVFYNSFVQEYDLARDASQNHKDNEFGLGAAMKVMPKTWAFARYFYGTRDYSDSIADATDADSKWHRVAAGMEWDSGARFSGELNLGLQFKEYDNTRDASGAAYGDENTWVAATSVNYNMSDATTVTGTLTRALRQSGADTRETFEDTLLGVMASHTFMTKYTAVAGVNFGNNSYNTGRDDDNVGLKLGIKYDIQDWLAVQGTYDYYKKDSNDNDQDYTSNKFLLGVKAVY